jgi:polysaccharide export outer membrane protein
MRLLQSVFPGFIGWRAVSLHAIALLGFGQLAACAYIPSDGPLKSDIDNEYQPRAAQHPFELVEISDATLGVLQQRDDASLAARFGGDAAPPELKLGIGDALNITIWETGSQPLFATTPITQPAGNASRGVSLPEQSVDTDGCISVPFAGRIHVAGSTLVQVEADIKAALVGKAANPQVLVTLSRNLSNTVTVVGEVTGGGRIALSPHGDRLLDVLASAGGIRAPTYETWIRLTRAGLSMRVPMAQILDNPADNVFLQPDDALLVTRQPESFTAFGATGRNAQIIFEAAHVSLIEAVAKAGGLQDQRADPRAVFLMRKEPASIGAALAGSSAVENQALMPVVYRLDLTKASGYFLAQSFAMRDGDMLFVSSAPANELQKFLTLLGLITQPAIEGAVLNSSLK